MKKLHRFFLRADVSAAQMVFSDRDFIHQIRDVLRLQDGESIVICDGLGREAQVILDHMHTTPGGRVMSVVQNQAESPVAVTLFCSVLKREHFEWVVQKAVELGAHAIVPVICERTIKLGTKQDRLEKIAKEAAELAGRGMIPEISEPISLTDALRLVPSFDAAVCFDPEASRSFVSSQGRKSIALFVGPEGGWSEAEQASFKKAEVESVALGPRILRAETAAIAGLAVVITAMEK